MSAPDHLGTIAWEPWSPEQTSELLKGCGVEWAVVGGWALDLWRGAQSRPHKDLEIAIIRPALAVVRKHLARYEFFTANAGRLAQMTSFNCLEAAAHQHWILDPAASKWRLDVMVEPGDDQTWVYRRDLRISAPRIQVVATSDQGVPYLRPGYVLLFKAQQQRLVDELDFSRQLTCSSQVSVFGSAKHSASAIRATPGLNG